MPAVTYIVSVYERPRALRGCLACLQVQTDPDFEVIVANTGPNEAMQRAHEEVVAQFACDDPRFSYVNTLEYKSSPAWDCYWAAEWVVEHLASGDWICLPSDDSYYVPMFQERCLARARLNNWSLVWPEMLYDPRLHGRYEKLDARACVGGIDKTGFLIRRDAWIGFPSKPTDYSRSSCADGEMIAELVGRGVAHGKIDEIMVVHN